MAEVEEKKYGTYKTKLTTIKHSAVPSWSGFGYQGQCAVFHAVKLLNQDKDAVKDYYLSLESYEDFAIMDAAGQIVSLHQCKCYSDPVDFTDECQKMSDKREYYSKELHKCTEDVPCYFLSNVMPTKALVCDIKAYEFKPGQTTCNADKVREEIESVVSDYMITYSCARSEKTKASVLVSMVEQKVAEMHQKKSATTDFWQIATDRSNWIPFVDIIAALEAPDDAIKTEILRAIAARNAINTHVTKCLGDEVDEVDFPQKEIIVNRFLNALNGMCDDALILAIRRLHPHVEWNENGTVELRSSDKGENLYTLLTSTREVDSYSTLSWNDGGVLETPSTLGYSRKSVHLAKAIRESSVLAFLRDYRWIVGNIQGSIDNIMIEAPAVTDTDARGELERITRPSKLGLLSIEDKNDSDYVKNHS